MYIPDYIIFDKKYKGLGMAEKLLYATILDKAGFDVYCHYPHTELAKLFNVSTNTIKRYKDSLEAYGLIQLEEDRRNNTDRIWIINR